MIAADTSSLIAYLHGEQGADVEAVERAMALDELRLPPPVVSELLGSQSADVEKLLAGVPRIELAQGFWERAGRTRALVLSRGLKARLADALIAQCCIDAGASLVCRDTDFRHFARWGGLKLAVEFL